MKETFEIFDDFRELAYRKYERLVESFLPEDMPFETEGLANRFHEVLLEVLKPWTDRKRTWLYFY